MTAEQMTFLLGVFMTVLTVMCIRLLLAGYALWENYREQDKKP